MYCTVKEIIREVLDTDVPEPFAVVQVQRRFAPEAVSHSLALAASLDAQGYSVNDIIHILMAEGGQA